MRNGRRAERTRIATVLGVSIAVGALLVLAMFPTVLRTDRTLPQATFTPAATKCTTGDQPLAPGFDPISHEMYVPDSGLFGSPNITVYSGTCTLVGTIPVPTGGDPWQAAFNPENDYMYVTDWGLNVVYEISGLKILTTISGFDQPEGIIFDPSDEAMAVVNAGSDSVDFIVGTDVGYGFATGLSPTAIAYDYTCDCDLVTNTQSDNVTVYETHFVKTFSVSVGTDPVGIAYSFYDGFVYVANSGSNNVSVLVNDVNSATISGFSDPDAVAFDPATLDTYITNEGNGKVYLVIYFDIVKTEGTASGAEPSGLAYDEYNDKMYVTGLDTNLVYVVS